MGKILKSLILSALCCAAMVGCSSDGCLENRSSIPLAGFYNSENKAISLNILQVSGIGAPHDSILYDAGTQLSSIYLPMRATKTSTSWKFAYKTPELNFEELCDTITFDYEPTIWFASEQCGVIYRYRIDRVSYTTHLIESVVVTDSLITNTDIERIKIYFRTENGGGENNSKRALPHHLQ